LFDSGIAMKRIMIIAGEISGDMHGARLVSAIKGLMPDATFFGIGGDQMRAAGVEILHDVKDMAVMGFAEVVGRLAFFRRVFNEMLVMARDIKPDAVILIDYPGFNLRFAARVHESGLKVIYYICPQVWAWNRSRIPKMAATIDRLITIFPFEAEHFKGTGLKVDFAGHPLVDEARKTMDEPEIALPWNGHPRVALLPGSRAHVIDRILPLLCSAASLTAKRHADAGFIIAAPSQAIKEAIEARLAKIRDRPARCCVVAGNTRQVLRQATAAMVASGTATVEASLMLCPMIIAYQMAPLSYVLGRLLVRLDNIGMVNILAGRALCPEFIQDRATPENLANAMEPLLGDEHERRQMIDGLAEVNKALGTGNAAGNAARIVAEVVGGD
jgi:lipid-A-disaccharide synthase